MIENNVILYGVIELYIDEVLEYLNEIRPYINLTELCKVYNDLHPDNAIDYNNLRNKINGTAPNRLSEEKVFAFYDFLAKEIFEAKFKLKSNTINETAIHRIIHEKTNEMIFEISGVLEHGFSNK